jgi:hypothetical protein
MDKRRMPEAHPDVAIIGVSVDGAAGKADAQTFIDEQRLIFPNSAIPAEPKLTV